MPKSRPARELRERTPDSGNDKFAVSYKVYTFGRLRGAILPVKEPLDDARWEALDLQGNVTTWKYRNQARDYICGLPLRGNRPGTDAPGDAAEDD